MADGNLDFLAFVFDGMFSMVTAELKSWIQILPIWYRLYPPMKWYQCALFGFYKNGPNCPNWPQMIFWLSKKLKIENAVKWTFPDGNNSTCSNSMSRNSLFIAKDPSAFFKCGLSARKMMLTYRKWSTLLRKLIWLLENKMLIASKIIHRWVI